jgi:hypothetical protein
MSKGIIHLFQNMAESHNNRYGTRPILAKKYGFTLPCCISTLQRVFHLKYVFDIVERGIKVRSVV